MTGEDPRAELLTRALEYVAANGLSDVSLRGLAAALGTSHRMLIHHFGSKDGLWVEIIRTVEQRQRAAIAALVPDPGLPAGEALWAIWKQLSDPSLWPNERLFFEVYGQALQGRGHAAGLLEGIVEDWVAPGAATAIALGVPRERAQASARLGVAVTRGLLLDLLATGDVERVDAAMREYIALVEAGLDERA